MFYSDFVLSKKGPLARIWLAAHWDKKLTKAQIFETNIESSIEKILRPKMKLALRTSGHLMLGVVRIYSRKTKYLLADCNEAFVKIKMAFRPGMVDLPEDHREAAVNAVTLPEVFHDFDSVMPELNNMDIEVQFTLNQSRADEITMREDFDGVLPLHDDGFDLAFDASTSDALRHSVDFDQSLQHANLLFGEGIDAIDRSRDRPSTSDVNANLSNLSMDINLPKDDGFGGISGGGLFEGGLFEDVPMPSISNNSLPRDSDSNMPSTSREPVEDLNDHDFDNFDVPSPGGVSSNGSQPNSPMPNIPAEMLGNISEFDQNLAIHEHSSQNQEMSEIPALENKLESDINQTAEQTTLLQNEEESFALAPMNASVSVGIPKSKRKRKLIVDEVKNISGEEMKGQLSDTSDIVTTLDLAPPTKRLMRWKETGGMEKLFTLPGKIIPATALFKNYQKHLTSISSSNEDGKVDKENRDTVLDDGVFIPPTIPTVGKRGRKRKRAVAEEQDELPNQNQNIPQYQFNNNDEGLTPAPADLNLETAPWSGVPTSNVGSHDPVISPVEDNSINSHINIEGGMTPWHNTEYENPMPVPSNTVNENLVPLPYDMNAITQNPWSTPIPQPNQMPPMFVSNQENSENKENSWNNPDNSEFNKEPDHLPSITPWHDVDYYNPMSVEPAEEQRADETEEQFEERVSNKRAGQLYSAIKIKIATGVITTFDDLIVHNPKKQVAQKFYSLLVLKKHRVLELTQEAPYDTILLTKGQNFDDPKL